MKKVILVTGGAGYIGSHVCKQLKKEGFEPVVFDNFSNGHKWAVKWGPLFNGDIRNRDQLDEAFTMYSPDAVIHLAGLIDLRQ